MPQKTSNGFGECIKKFDLFFSNITFRMDGENEYKSVIGGLATICFAMICIGYIIYCSFSYILRDNVELIYSSKIEDDVPLIDFRNSDFMFSFSLSYKNPEEEEENSAIDAAKQYFDYSINLRAWKGEDEIIDTFLGHQTCTKDYFSDELVEEIEVNGILETLCPKLEKDSNLTLEGTFTDDYFKFLIIEIKLSEFAKSHLEELEKEMSNKPMELSIFFLGKSIDYENIKNPLSTIMNSAYTSLDFYFMKTIDIYFSNFEFIRDDNFVFEHKKKSIEPLFDSIEKDFRFFPERGLRNISTGGEDEFTDEDKDVIGRIRILANRKVIQISRKYQKLPSFIADIVDTLEEIGIILIAFITSFERKGVDHQLISRIFKYNGSQYYDVNFLIKRFSTKKANNVKNNEGKIPIFNKKNKKAQNVVKDSFQRTSLIALKSKTKENSKSLLSRSKSCHHKILSKSKNRSIYNPNIGENKISIFTKTKSLKSLKYSKSTRVKGGENYLDYDSLNLCSLTFILFCSCSKENEQKGKIIRKALSKVSGYLDIYKYIQNSQEFDVIKDYILDKDRKTLIDFVSKPSFNMTIKEKDIVKKAQTNNPGVIKSFKKDEINKIFDAYQKIKNRKKQKLENKKLIKLVDNEINFFQ